MPFPAAPTVSAIICRMREDGSNTKKVQTTESEQENRSVESFSPDEIAHVGNLISDDSMETPESPTSEDDTGEFEAIRNPD